MAISLKNEAIDEVKSETAQISVAQAGFVSQMAKLIADTAEQTQYKPIKDLRDGMYGAVASKLLHTITDKTSEILKSSKMSFSNMLTSLHAGDAAAEKMTVFGDELISSNEEAFEIIPSEDAGNYSAFDVDEEVFTNLSRDTRTILEECIAFNELKESAIRENMGSNIIYAPILVFHKCRSAIIEHFLTTVCASVKRLEKVYISAVEEIRSNRADVDSTLTISELMGLAAYTGVKNMEDGAGAGGGRKGGRGADEVPVPPSLGGNEPDIPDETHDDVPINMKNDGNLLDREGKLKYFMYNFIDGCAIRTDEMGNVSALEEFTDWFEDAMNAAEVSCADVVELVSVYNSFPQIAENYVSLSSSDIVGNMSQEIPQETRDRLGAQSNTMGIVNEAINLVRIHCNKTELKTAAQVFGIVADCVRSAAIPEGDELYASLCESSSQRLHSMIESKITYGDYIDYKRLKGEML